MAAASLQDVFREMDRTFEANHPGTRVLLSTGASSVLRTQIQQGAPADLFAAADTKNVDMLAKAGLTSQTSVFTRNELVIAVPASNPAHIKSLADLSRPGVRLVMTAPQVPIGHYTQTLLARIQQSGKFGAGFAAAVKRNVVSQQPDVRSLLAQVELGEADAAIVYATDTVAGGAKVRAIAIPPELNVIGAYKVAVLRHALQPGLARDYVKLLLSPDGQALLRKNGFMSSRTPL
ncbi:MAG TPA: molybdate ABC transporter substrate-binding protein [Armatimonadota bacterium]|nr:molybdate ABC transporter substrate-binding protein [Armatimonadota bacterium]